MDPLVPLTFAAALVASFGIAHRVVRRHRIHTAAEARAQEAEGAWLEQLFQPVPDDPFTT